MLSKYQLFYCWGCMEYFLELHFANIYKFFQFFRKRQLLFLNENKITFKEKFTTIDIKKNWKPSLHLLHLSTLSFHRGERKKKRTEREGEEKRF